jgi:hypothetical protein
VRSFIKTDGRCRRRHDLAAQRLPKPRITQAPRSEETDTGPPPGPPERERKLRQLSLFFWSREITATGWVYTTFSPLDRSAHA